MPYSPTKVLPEPVGAQTTTERPAFREAIASSWNLSSSKGNTELGSTSEDSAE